MRWPQRELLRRLSAITALGRTNRKFGGAPDFGRIHARLRHPERGEQCQHIGKNAEFPVTKLQIRPRYVCRCPD